MSLTIVLQPRAERAIVSGEGHMATEKAQLLMTAGFDVARFGDGLRIPRMMPADLKGAWLLVAASDSADENQRSERLARDAGILVNVADVPQRCDFYFPAVVQRGPLIVAISSSGTSPAMAQWLRDRADQALLKPDVVRLAEALGSARPRVKRALPGFDQRKAFWDFVKPTLDKIDQAETLDEALLELRQRLSQLEVA